MSAYYMTHEGQVFRPLQGESTQGYRQVAVIDFEDREQVERLIFALPDAVDWGFASADDYDDPDNLTVAGGVVEPFQAALREFANPKPVERTVTLTLDGRHTFLTDFLRFVATHSDTFHAGLASDLADQIDAQVTP